MNVVLDIFKIKMFHHLFRITAAATNVTKEMTMRISRHKNFAEFSAGVNGRIYSTENMYLEKSALDEAENFSKCEGLKDLSFTPDFHKGSGVPVGTVALMDRIYPSVVGNDIGCGMSLYVTSLTTLDITPEIKTQLRNVFFNGVRDVHVKSRSDLLEYGFIRENLFGDTIQNVPFNGHMQGQLGFGGVSNIFHQYLSNSSSRENFLGSVGGGNHFVELQKVGDIFDGHRAYELGLKKNQICIMIHSGSLDIGQLVGRYFTQLAKSKWNGKYPQNGMFYLSDKNAKDYMIAARNAANFAVNNRFVMANMMASVLKTDMKVVYDSPHNLVWEASEAFLYRKGSCPAGLDEPVIIPGSMGTKSALCVGKGFSGTHGSSPHGSGRVLSRNAGRVAEGFRGLSNSTDSANVITKISLEDARNDVAREIKKSLAEEAPRCYKDIEEVIHSVRENSIADLICWLNPLLTIKG